MSTSSKNVIRCTATGDAMITKRLPIDGEYSGFNAVRDFIMQGDFRFSNLETTVHNFESCAGARSGGSWLCSPPGVLEDMRKFGFNILSTANNHALDYSYEGLEKTLQNIERANFPFTGTGRSLADASKPAYLDTVSGRYALIACSMSFNPENMAGAQSSRLPGRPGVNGIRVNKKYLLPPEDLKNLEQIAAKLGINCKDEILRGEGYLPQLKEGVQPFGDLMFELSDHAEIVSTVNESDMQRITAAIAEARFMADYVVVSMHNHELCGKSKETVDPVSIEFAPKCIDSGADAVIGTGPHLLRPMEIYNGKPIFYCLGDFIIQLETIQSAPEDMFARQKLSGDERLDVLFNTRSNFGKRGLCYDPIMYKSVIPYWEVTDGQLSKMTFMPIEEMFALPRSRSGWPQPNNSMQILEHFAGLSRNFGVDIKIENNLGVLQI